MYFVPYPKQGLRTEGAALHRVGFFEYFCPKQGQDFNPLAAPLYRDMGQVPPPPQQVTELVGNFVMSSNLQAADNRHLKSHHWISADMSTQCQSLHWSTESQLLFYSSL